MAKVRVREIRARTLVLLDSSDPILQVLADRLGAKATLHILVI